MRAYTYEASLLKLQFDLKKGVFACPGYDVYSNQDTEGGFATFSIKLLLDIACLSENPTGGKSVEDPNLSCWHESVKAQDPVEGEEQEKDTLIQEVRMLMDNL